MPETPPITEFKYPEASRKNLPPAGSPPGERVAEQPKVRFAYDPHRPPTLQFNEGINRYKALLEKAAHTSLSREETTELARALEAPHPWLEWTGKREQSHFEVEPVALHIHERVSAQAILRTVQREDVQRDFFAEPRLPAREARAYYQHDVDWANRMILGDSLQVMTSLARREGLGGKVQMIYLDPPYGIRFSSNWQNEVGKRDVKDKDEDLTREPEMIKAYRDTWTLGVHSYLTYLKQRLILARELLADSGSVFVQISDENLHRVRAVMDEVFGPENFCNEIKFTKTSSSTADFLSSISDYVLFFAKDKSKLKYRPLFLSKGSAADDGGAYSSILEVTGERRRMSAEERAGTTALSDSATIFRIDNLQSQSLGREKGEGAACWFPVSFTGKQWLPSMKARWKTNEEGMMRLSRAERLDATDTGLYYLRTLEDFPVKPINDLWSDTSIAGFASDKMYVVQTSTKIVERCMLMTTDPGDLVLDPTCGSGTTAFVAEQWGRRWITIDSSRVAAAIARQRLLTANFDAYKTRDENAGVDPNSPQNPSLGFIYKTVAHITLKSIAQNQGLDPIFDKHGPILATALAALNEELAPVTDELRERLVKKLIVKLQTAGARFITDADKRRLLLPGTNPQLIQIQRAGPSSKQTAELRLAIPSANTWQEWEVPFDVDPDWPLQLQSALVSYRKAWKDKMDEVNAAISANAEQEELVDQPEPMRGVLRVSGPFTVESIRPSENSPEMPSVDSPIVGAPEEIEEVFDENEAGVTEASNAASHIERSLAYVKDHIGDMLELMKSDGITFLGNKHMRLARLDRIESSFLHAEGEIVNGEEHRVAVVIGPEFGSVPSFLVEEAMRFAYRRGFDDLVVAGFSFDAMAQEKIQDNNDDPSARLRIHMAQIRPDVTMGDLLKKSQVTSQIFTVFGQPRTRLTPNGGDEWTVHMDGVDIYDPVKNSIDATNAGKVAAWFVDTDYDGKVFCICQAFFPDKGAWEKLGRALKGSLDERAFDALTGTVSLPFKAGKRKTVAVKVIDPRGNEVMRVHRIGGTTYSV